MKSVFYLPFFFMLGILSSCDNDAEYYTVKYLQQIRFYDTNEVIRTIYYPQINRTDTIDSLYTYLRVSENFPTVFQIKSDKSFYSFKIQMKFIYKDKSDGSKYKEIQRIYDGIDIMETNAIETTIKRSNGYIRNSYSYERYNFVNDLITVK